jgi:hypothetical protein
MASLPTPPSFNLRFTAITVDPKPTAIADRKLRMARQLRDEDRSRRTTSIAPPARRHAC